MMSNLFSMFDPSSSFFSMAWMIIMPPMLMLKNNLSLLKDNNKKMMNMLINFIKKELNQLMGKINKFSADTMSKTFMIIFFMNMLSIFPFNFTPTAHMTISLSISMSMWVSIMIFGWMNQFKSMMIHLTPSGTPNSLMNFMVIIETVSSLIRPITLSIRLSANMVAGHLLLSLLSSFSLSSYSYFMMSFFPMMVLILLELMVAMVQAYVLATLVTLYQTESN